MSVRQWAGLVALLVGVIALLAMSAGLGARLPTRERVLFIMPTADVLPLLPLTSLPRTAPRFEAWQQLFTGRDGLLFVGEVQRYAPEVVPYEVPPTWVPAYPTTPPLPASPSRPQREGVLPYGGDGCAPRGVPVEGTLNQGFHAYHLGVDIGVQVGTPVRATHSGTVVFADWSEIGYGYLVILQNAIFTTYYAHNSALYVQASEQVGRGSVIAASGSSGNSTGPHLHYEVRLDDRPVDPLTFEDAEYVTC